MSATAASGARPSARITSCGFCQASRSGSSKTCAHFSASPKLCWCVPGDCASAGCVSKRAAPETASAASRSRIIRFPLFESRAFARRQADAVVRFVQVLHDLLELVERELALRLRRPARDFVAQVGHVLDLGARPVVHPLVVAAAAMRLIQQLA